MTTSDTVFVTVTKYVDVAGSQVAVAHPSAEPLIQAFALFTDTVTVSTCSFTTPPA